MGNVLTIWDSERDSSELLPAFHTENPTTKLTIELENDIFVGFLDVGLSRVEDNHGRECIS